MNPVLRRFSIATRKEIFSGQIDGAGTADSTTLGIYRFNYDNVSHGAYTDVRAGMTIDIGTTPGARDIGYTRVRKAPTSSIMYIAEIAAGRLPIANNLYFTVREEYLPWRVLPRGVGTSTGGATYTNDLTLYMDYDITYTDQNAKIPPKANITRSALSYMPPKPAGYLDTGLAYRTIVLSSAQSFGVSAAIASRLWEVEDCTIVDGTSSSTTITIRAPEGFRYIHLTVTDGNSVTGVMHFPLWVHGSTFAPIVNFKITSDETNEIGRSINFEFFGADNLVNQTVLPRMSLICYWEEEALTQPANYRDQYLGWAKREATVLRLYRTRYLLETTGIAGWLDTFGGSSLYIYNPLETPDRWYEMQNITIDKCAYFILLYFSNAMTICNFYMSGNDYPSKGETIEIGAVWRQVVEMVKGYYGVAGADSLNGIWLRKSFFYLTTDERNAIANTSTITRDKLTDDAPVTFKNELTKQVGLLIGGGSYFDGTDNTIYASSAPGLVSSDEAGEQQAPGQRLPASGPQTELNRVTGHHYAFTNNPNMDIVFELIGNDDIYEPALMLPFLYNEAMGNVAGLTVSKRFIPRSVSVTHSNRVGDKSKRVIVTAHGETFGSTAATKPVPVYDSEIPPVIIRPTPVNTTTTPELDPYTADLLPTKIFISAMTTSQAAIATSITTGGTFIWTEISTGLTGNSVWGSSDPYDYEYMYLLTTTGIYRSKPYSFAGWTLVATNLQMFGNATYVGNNIYMSINRRGWIYVISGTSMAAWSNDYGATWTNNGGTAGTGGSQYHQNVVVSPHNDGASAIGWMYKTLYTGSGLNTVYKSTNWGVTWTALSTLGGAWQSGNLNIPYTKSDGSPNINDSTQLLYHANGAGHGANVGYIQRSLTAGATWAIISGGVTGYVPAGSFNGNSIQTFTHDGGVILCGNLITGAGGGIVGLRVEDDGVLISNAGLVNVGASYLGSMCVNGFSYSRLSALAWNQYGANAELNYTFDGGVNTYSANLPSFFSGSPKLIGYAEWPLVDQWG